jgi:hypothetical protein
MLQTQPCRELNLWQTGHEIAEKSSKIVPLGAPVSLGHLFSITSSITPYVVSNLFGSDHRRVYPIA